MTVYGPRLYFGPLDTPTGPVPDSSCSRDTMGGHPPKEHRMTDTLTFIRQPSGKYQADTDGSTGVLRWIITNTGPRSWEITSITTGWERRRHGAAYTLREAKEATNNFHTFNLTRFAPKGQ